MNTEDMEIIRDLLMYLAAAEEITVGSNLGKAFSYVRHNLKTVYDRNLKIEIVKEVDKNIPEINPDLLETSVYDLNLTLRTFNCLKAENILTLERLIQCSESDLFKLPNLGKKSLKEIKDVLSTFGLELSKNNFLCSDKNPWKF